MLFSEGSIALRIIFVAVLLLVNFYYNLIPYYLTQYFHTRYAANFLEKYSDCKFLINNPRDFLSQEALDYDFNKRIGGSEGVMRKWYTSNIENNTYFFQVDPGSSKQFPRNAKVFTGEFGTLVFVPETSQEIKPFGKFKLLHEYFHSSEVSLFFERQLVFRNTLSILTLIFVLVNVHLNIWSVITLILLILLLLFESRFYWDIRKADSVFNAELMSDFLAVKHMDQEEIDNLKSSPYLEMLIGDDAKLSDNQNTIRKKHFVRLIKEGTESIDEFTILQSNHTQNSLNLNTIISILIIFELYFIKTISWSLILYNTIFLVLFFSVSMFFIQGAFDFYRKRSEEILGVNLSQEDFFKRRIKRKA